MVAYTHLNCRLITISFHFNLQTWRSCRRIPGAECPCLEAPICLALGSQLLGDVELCQSKACLLLDLVWGEPYESIVGHTLKDEVRLCCSNFLFNQYSLAVFFSLEKNAFDLFRGLSANRFPPPWVREEWIGCLYRKRKYVPCLDLLIFIHPAFFAIADRFLSILQQDEDEPDTTRSFTHLWMKLLEAWKESFSWDPWIKSGASQIGSTP